MPVKYFIKSKNEIVAESHSAKQLYTKLTPIAMIKCMGCNYNTCDRDTDKQELFYGEAKDIMVFPMCASFTERNFQVYYEQGNMAESGVVDFDTYQDAMKYVYSNQDNFDFTLEETLLLHKHIAYIKQEECKLKITEN